ncbi:RTA1 domain-containing protein [Phlyctema vagabunda]|uniref:RTA1 domain-containing protein n=1 Tax=Phlyctema vagabunda TaxID=108571 RepID=A0ABR4PUZ0_9HELO
MGRVCLPPDDPDNQWGFCPSFNAAIAFTCIFGLLTLLHLGQGFYHGKAFCWVIVMTASWETVGLAFRVLASTDQSKSVYQTTSQILVLLAPLWLNAFVYMVFGRAVYYWLPGKRIGKLKARTLTKYFVWLDVVIFCVQATGGSLLDSDDAQTAKNGLYIYQGGLGMQQTVVVIFWGMLVYFRKEVLAHGKARDTSWAPLIYTLALALLFITVRIIFRFIEFNSGTEGRIPTHEVYFYLLEATPMSLALAIFVLIHPGRFLVGPESEFSKLVTEKGRRRWWCLGRRRRTKIDPDFELDDRATRKRSSVPRESWREPLVPPLPPRPSRSHHRRHSRRDRPAKSHDYQTSSTH